MRSSQARVSRNGRTVGRAEAGSREIILQGKWAAGKNTECRGNRGKRRLSEGFLRNRSNCEAERIKLIRRKLRKGK